MPVFNTPITTDDTNLAKVLGQPLPVALYLYDSRTGTNRCCRSEGETRVIGRRRIHDAVNVKIYHASCLGYGDVMPIGVRYAIRKRHVAKAHFAQVQSPIVVDSETVTPKAIAKK